MKPRFCLIKEKWEEKEFKIDGIFHCWTLDLAETRENIASYVVGIVELKDGTVKKVLPEMIKFKNT
jgi:hypothetical protein